MIFLLLFGCEGNIPEYLPLIYEVSLSFRIDMFIYFNFLFSICWLDSSIPLLQETFPAMDTESVCFYVSFSVFHRVWNELIFFLYQYLCSLILFIYTVGWPSSSSHLDFPKIIMDSAKNWRWIILFIVVGVVFIERCSPLFFIFFVLHEKYDPL